MLQTDTVHNAPTSAERVRSACRRGGGGRLVITGADPTETPLHHLLDDGSCAVAVPAASRLARTVLNADREINPAVLEVTDYAPLPVREPVRLLAWLTGRLSAVPSAERLALLDRIAADEPNPVLLQINTTANRSDTGYALLRLRIESAVVADATGADAIDLDTLLAAAPDPFCTQEAHWLRHLDSAHRDLLGALTNRLPPALRRGPAQLLGLDRYGLTLRAETAHGDRDVRLPFAQPVDDVTGLSRSIRLLVGCPFRNGLRARQGPEAH